MAGRRKGFTLIELMISIAILAIFLSIPVAAIHGLQGLQREEDYRFALVNARSQLQRLRSESFDALPPQSVRVGPGGWASLGHADLLESSVTVRRAGQEVATRSVDAAKGRVLLDPSLTGQTVVVDYEYFVPDRNEAHLLGDDASVTLENLPLRKVEAVWIARGESLRASRSFQADLARGRVTVKDAPKGALVLIDYAGGRLRNKVSGHFLDQSFTPTPKPTRTKLLEVSEQYGGEWRLSLPLLKEAP
jgi:prepilin-type N-terminal cleavage/methylation domain-containing protein